MNNNTNKAKTKQNNELVRNNQACSADYRIHNRYRVRQFGVGYGRSSGYAQDRSYIQVRGFNYARG